MADSVQKRPEGRAGAFSLVNRSSKRFLLALSVALGLQLTLPLGAHAAAAINWPRLENLLTHRAYRIAVDEIRSALPTLLGEERHQARYWLAIAERHLKEGAKARQALEAIPASSLWFTRAQRELAAELRAEGKIEEADQILYRLIGFVSGQVRDEVRLNLADDWFAREKYQKALDLYQRGLDDGSTLEAREHAAFAAGWCYERLANPARAIWSWKEAIRLFPRSKQVVPARLMLANQYLKLGKPLLASDEIRAITKNANDPELEARSYFMAGEGYAEVGTWKLALASYAQVKPGTRWSEPSEYGAAFARWQSGDAKGAKPAFAAWLKKYPQSPVRSAVLYALGRVNLELGLQDEAIGNFEAAIKGKIGDPYAELSLFGLAELSYNQNQFQACADLSKRLLTEYPQTRQRGPSRWLLAESLLALKRYDGAIAVYLDMAKNEGDLSFLEGKGDAVTFRLGLAHFRAGNFPAAASYLNGVTDGHYGEAALYWLSEALYRIGEHAAALDTYGRYLKANPSTERSAEAAYGQAYCAYHLQRWDQAKRLFKQAIPGLKTERMREDARLRLGALQTSAHEWAAARSTYETLYSSQLSPKALPEVLWGLAWSTFRLNRHVEAVKLANDFSERFSSHPQVNQARMIEGQSLFQLGEYKEAVSSFEAVLKDEKSTAAERSDAKLRIGAAYFNAGMLGKAIEAYQEIYQDPQRSKAEREKVTQPLFQARFLTGDLDGARQMVLEQPSGFPWIAEAHGRLASGYMEAKRPKDAITALTAIDNPSLEQRHLLADAYLAQGEIEASLTTLESITQEPSPSQTTWLAELAQRYLDASQPDRARETYARLTKLDPKHPAILKGTIALAASYAKAGQDSLALEAYQLLANQLAPRTEIAQGALMKSGQLQLKAGKYAMAVLSFRQAEKASAPGSANAYQARYWLGYCLVATQRYEDAVTELAKLKPSLAVERVWLALATLKLGEAHEHLRHWKEATKLYRKLSLDAKMPPSERQEASNRLKWIATNIQGG